MTDPVDFPAVMDAIQRNADASARLLVAAETLRDLQNTTAASGGKAEIHFNAGGVGLWVAVTACIVSLVSVGFLAAIVFWVSSRTVDQGHQMNALYQSTPGLRELVERQMRQNEAINQPEEPQE